MRLEQARVPVFVAYGQYYLMDAEADPPRRFTTGGTGLIGSLGDAAVVAAGTHTGTVQLSVEVYDGPPALDLDGWDDVVDVSVELPGAELYVGQWGAGAASIAALPQAGDYRVRVHARGRDAGRAGEEVEGSTVEEHLVALWPDRLAPSIVWKATDGVGAYHRHSEDQRPPVPGVPAVEVRGELATYRVEDWFFKPEGVTGVRLSLDRVVLRSATLDIVLTALVSYPAGCMFHVRAVARRADLPELEWLRRKDLTTWGFSVPRQFRGQTAQHEALRLTLDCPGQPAVTSKPGPSRPGEEPAPTGPVLTGYWVGAMVTPDVVTVDHQAWHWPLPPPALWQLTIEWAALDVAPTTIELDVAMGEL